MTGNRKVPLVANDRQNIGGRWLRPEEKFEADEAEADDIMALGIGRKDVSREPPQPISAAKAKQKPVTKQGVKRKYVKSGLYKRKDMRAED